MGRERDYPTVPKHPAITAEQQRVRELIERHKADHAREIVRAAAEIELASGKTASILDAVMEPTPEWRQHGDVERYTPRQPDGTVRQVTTVRRVLTPIALRMLRAGKIDNEQYRTCVWYAATYERAGLMGTIPSVQIGREVFGGGPDRVLFTEAQQDAQRALRRVKAVIPKHEVRFFEAVVIGDVPITRASRFLRAKPAKALKRFRFIVEQVCDEVKNLGGIA